MYFQYIKNSTYPTNTKMNTDNNNMTNEEFFALHPQPELVIGHAYPTLIFPEEVEEDDDDDATSIYAFPSKPEKYKRQYAVDLTDIPKNLLWEFDKVVVEEEEEEEDYLNDLPDLISIEECNAGCPVSQARLNHKQSEESYWSSLTTIDEIDDAIQKSLSRQYNLAEINKKKIKEDKEDKERMRKKDREERMQIINDGEMRRFSILQDKEEQERVQAIKDREMRCFRTLENRKDNRKN